jgi:multiple sugar transport system ATP-binding protein
MARISLDSVDKIYDNGQKAVSGLSLEITDGEFLVLVGPSGCGKSTALRMIAGLETISGGTVTIDDVVVNDLESKDRDIAMVFQSYALYPHLTVRDNIAFALKLRKVPKDEIARRVDEAARVLELTDFLDRRPAKLSGGQRQRVAMGRAIVRQPKAFLMDEPLSNLDAKLRVQMRAEIAKLQRDLAVTTVYVTHDQVEAMTMGDRVAVLKDGLLQQCASPRDLFTRPVNAFVAGFIGSPAMNMMDATADERGAVFGTMVLPLTPAQRSALTSAAVTVGVRPENLHARGEGGLDALVVTVEELGSESYLYCVPEQHPEVSIVSRSEGLSSIRPGDSVHLVPDHASLHLFDGATGLRLPD